MRLDPFRSPERAPELLSTEQVAWFTTALMALFISSGAFVEVMRTPEAVQAFVSLGYPTYLVRLVGTLELLAVATISLDRAPRLVQWAYAGLFFDVALAAYSHARSGSPAVDVIVALIGAVIVLCAYSIRELQRW